MSAEGEVAPEVAPEGDNKRKLEEETGEESEAKRQATETAEPAAAAAAGGFSAEQLAAMAAAAEATIPSATNFPQVAATPSVSGLAMGAGAMTTEVIDIAKGVVGKIIGKMGATIQNLQDRSGARIQIDQNVPEGLPCNVSVSGSPAAVASAKQMILDLTAEGMDVGGGAPMAGESSETMDIDQQMVGRVIGRGGETIKGLQVQSGAHITIDQNFPDGAPRKATVTGSAETVQRAMRMIQDLIAGGPSAVSVPGGAEKLIDIQQNIVGKIIGKGGETIKGMQTQTGARIQIDQNTWKCTITGTESAVEQAGTMIQTIVNGGDPPSFGPPPGAYPGYGAPAGYAPPGYGGYPGYGVQPGYGAWGAPAGGGYGGYPGYPPQQQGGYGGYPGYGQQPPGYGAYPGYGQQPAAGTAQASGAPAAEGSAAPAAAAAAPAAASAAAPAAGGSAWQTLYDTQNRPYYYNSATQLSQWEKPADM